MESGGGVSDVKEVTEIISDSDGSHSPPSMRDVDKVKSTLLQNNRMKSKVLGLHATKFTGVRKRKSGKYVAEIRDPIKKRTVWLGTFNTAQDASKAYFVKQCEFEQLVKANQASSAQLIPPNLTQAHCSNTSPRPFIKEISLAALLRAESKNTGTFDFPCKGKPVEEANGNPNNVSVIDPKHIVGVHRNKYGMYTSEIIDPISDKKIWLGTFHTREEASQVYQSKKVEFQKQGKEELITKAKGSLVGIRRQKNGKYGAVIRDPVKSKQVWLGTFDTLELASEAILSKKSEFQKLSNSSSGERTHSLMRTYKKRSGNEITNSITKKIKYLGTFGTAQEASQPGGGSEPRVELSHSMDANKSNVATENEDLLMGQWVQLAGDRQVKYSQKLGLPIIDSYGFLLGEFSSLDDLSLDENEF